MQTTLDELLINRDQDRAITYCKGVISDLLQNRVDLSLLVITKGLAKRFEEKNGEESKKGDGAYTGK